MARKVRKKVEEEEDGYDFEQDVSIDPFHLDAEVLGYPRLVGLYASLAAEANREAKRATEELKTCRSECVKAAWEGCEGMNGVKPSVQTVEAYYRNDEEYKELKQAVIDAEFDADILNGCVSAINSKKFMLADSLRLISMEYFATPKMPHNVKEVVEKLEANRRGDVFERIRQNLNKSED